MKPTVVLDRATTPDGAEMLLCERDGVFTIRVDGLELMSSRAHGSEEALANLVLSSLGPKRRPRVLVGGLGMGYTLRAVLDAKPPASAIVVAELIPAVVRWNRSRLGHLAGAPLDDPRVTLLEADVGRVIADSPRSFDAILLDVDNGPSAFTVERNQNLYGPAGIAAIRRCLRSDGRFGVWSAEPAPGFERLLRSAGFDVEATRVWARKVAKGPKHTIFVARGPGHKTGQ